MIRKPSHLFTWVSLALLLGGSVAFAQSGTTPANTTTPAKTVKSPRQTLSDAEFAKLAAEGGMTEAKFGQLAVDKGATQAVKDFGQRMITDHNKAEDQLKAAAANDKVTLPSEWNSKDQATYDRLSKLSGESFDRAYARDVVREHSADVADFRLEARNGKDADLKAFASQNLPMLQDHLKQAREILSSTSNTSHNEAKTTNTTHT